MRADGGACSQRLAFSQGDKAASAWLVSVNHHLSEGAETGMTESLGRVLRRLRASDRWGPPAGTPALKRPLQPSLPAEHPLHNKLPRSGVPKYPPSCQRRHSQQVPRYR